MAPLEPYPRAAAVLVDEFDAPANSVTCCLTLVLMPTHIRKVSPRSLQQRRQQITSALILISASAGLFAVLDNSVTAACGLIIAAFTPIGLALTMPLEARFPLPEPGPQVHGDGIIMLPGATGEGLAALSKLGQEYPKARLALCGFGPAGKILVERLADAGIDAAHINIVSQ